MDDATRLILGIKKAAELHDRLGEGLRDFLSLLKAGEGAPKGWVWADPFLAYFRQQEPLWKHLGTLDKTLEALSMVDGPIGGVAYEARLVTTTSAKARSEYAMGVLDFFPYPATGDFRMAYRRDRLLAWEKAFRGWNADSKTMIKDLLRAATSAV